MVTPAPIADLLEETRLIATDGVVQSAQLSRKSRELLLKAEWLHRIIRGWYLLLRPTDPVGTTTAWYAAFWPFVSQYLDDRLGDGYCLSAESSLDLHLGPTQIPEQVVVVAEHGGSTLVELPENRSLLTYRQSGALPPPEHVTRIRGVRVMTLPLALARVSPTFFERQSGAAEMAVRMLDDPSALIRILLSGNRYVTASERLAGAFEAIGAHDYSERTMNAMTAAGHSVKARNPFKTTDIVFGAGARIRSPYAARVQMLWNDMRKEVLETFQLPSARLGNAKALLQRMDDSRVEDAYHSLSIEGYRVTPALIRQVRDGEWSLELEQDRSARDALAAKGYAQTYELVRDSVAHAAQNEELSKHVMPNIQAWYSALFLPSVSAGLVSTSDLAGYRSGAVYIRGARHVPPPHAAVIDAMQTFSACMEQEPSAVVRAILGHFILVWIHPFPDGNGRLARFIMNASMVVGGYPWTIIRVEKRAQYMRALESASTERDIKPFTAFIGEEARASLAHWKSHE